MSFIQPEPTVHGLTLLSICASSIPSESMIYTGKWYDLVHGSANLRRNVKASLIWQFGCDYITTTSSSSSSFSFPLPHSHSKLTN